MDDNADFATDAFAGQQRFDDISEKKEDLNSLIVESMASLLVVLNRAGRIVRFNRASEVLTGYSFEEVKGRCFWDFLLVPGDVDAVREKIKDLRADNFSNTHENYWVTKSGEKRLISWSNTSLRREANGVGFIVATGTDVTEQRQSEKSLRESYNLLNTVIEGISDSIFLKDTAGRYRLINTAGAKSVGKTASEIVGFDDSELFDAPNARRIIEQDRQIIRSGELKTYEETSVTAGGTVQTFHTSKAIYYDFEGKPAGLIGISHDITARKKIEECLRESEERYRSVVAAMSEGVVLQDATGAVAAANASAERILDLTSEQLKGRSSIDSRWRTIHEDGSEFPGNAHPAMVALRTGEPCKNVTMGVYTARGGLVWICINAQPIFKDDKTKAAAVVTTFTDITERKLADERLRLLESAVRQSNDAVLITTAELDEPGPEIIFANLAFLNMTGYRLDEVIGRTPRFLQGEKTERAVIAELRESLLAGRDYRGSTVNYRKDGSEYDVEWSISPIKNSAGKTINYIAVQQDITERRRNLEILRESENRYRLLFERNPQPMWVFDSETLAFLAVNDAAIRHYGYARQEFLAMTVKDISPAGTVETRHETAPGADSGTGVSREWKHLKKDGAIIDVEVTSNRMPFAGRPAELVLSHDVTERKRVEEALRQNEGHLRQAQKMESVGRLAGGIAHDFNNMLMVISGYSNLTLRRLKADDPLTGNIREIGKAAERSAALTRQLLAFSRRQHQQLKILNINQVIDELHSMLERLVGENVEIIKNLDAALGQVKADAGQIEQILMNLIVNSRDAMPDGGRITVATGNVFLDENFVEKNLGSRSGRYIRFSVADTGSGIDARTQRQIFEPFFTTKETGKGTGLGLATVYGIVKQSDGYITVASRVGRGTTFEVYLPEVNQAAEIAESPRTENAPKGGNETILLAEDEETVRNLTCRILESSGYKVIAAADGIEALAVCASYGGTIDLLLTDMIMPKLSGCKLVERVLALLPDLKVIYMSGYNEETTAGGNSDESRAAGVFLEKPFAPEVLLEKVRETIESAGDDKPQ